MLHNIASKDDIIFLEPQLETCNIHQADPNEDEDSSDKEDFDYENGFVVVKI